MLTNDCVVIFEPNLSGHRINYLNLFTNYFHSKFGYSLILIVDPAYKNSQIRDHLTFLTLDKIEIIEFSLPTFIKKIYAWRKLYIQEVINYLYILPLLKSIKSRKGIRFIFYPYLDHLLRITSLIKNPFYDIEFLGIAMNATFHHRHNRIYTKNNSLLRNKIEEFLYLNLLKKGNLKKVFSIDPALVTYIKSKYDINKVDYFPDPIHNNEESISRSDARKMLGIDFKGKILLVYGSITKRKGVLELFKALSKQVSFPNIYILVAGKINFDISEINTQICNYQNSVLIHNQYIDKNKEHIYFKASDIIWCGYKDFYQTSAVYIQGAFYGLPVISCDQGLLAYQTIKNKNGICININKNANIIDAIDKLLNNDELYKIYKENGLSFSQNHEEQNALSKIDKYVAFPKNRTV